MAYDSSARKPDDEEETQGAQPSGAGGFPAPTAPAAGSNPSDFVSFGQYFNANKGAAENLGANYAGGLGKDATQGLTDAYDKFRSDVAAGTPSQLYPTLSDPTDPRFGHASAGKGSAANERTVGMSDASIAAMEGKPVPPPSSMFTAQTEGQYAGPQSFSESPEFAGLQSRFNQASARAKNLGDPGTMQTDLAAQNQSRADYGEGASSFDAALGVRGGEAGGSFSAFRQRFADPTAALNADASAGDKLVAEAKKQTANQNTQYESDLAAANQDPDEYVRTHPWLYQGG